MNERFMRTAISLSLKNARTRGGGPFGAVVVCGDEIVAAGVNRVTRTNDPTAHAEIAAIRKACRKLGVFELKGCDLYTSCEPCPMCLGAIYWARLARVYYAGAAADAVSAGFDDVFILEQVRLDPSQRRIPMTQILRQESLAAFEAWKSNPNRISY